MGGWCFQYNAYTHTVSLRRGSSAVTLAHDHSSCSWPQRLVRDLRHQNRAHPLWYLHQLNIHMNTAGNTRTITPVSEVDLYPSRHLGLRWWIGGALRWSIMRRWLSGVGVTGGAH